MECLNAEVSRTLPLRKVTRGTGTLLPGLGECLIERLGSDQGAIAPVISEILVNAGLAEPAEVPDAATHTQIRGIRLHSAWTWHIGSGDVLPGSAPYSGGETDTWLARCPVCRTGILGQVTGKRLFGIPPTDYYLDCSHCGAKFIPEKNRFGWSRSPGSPTPAGGSTSIPAGSPMNGRHWCKWKKPHGRPPASLRPGTAWPKKKPKFLFPHW